MNEILVVAAHPDDEVLGCGGSICRHSASGDRIHILIMAEGITSRDPGWTQSAQQAALAALQRSAGAAATELGAQPPRFAGLPDNRLDSIDLLDIVKIVESAIDEIKPAIVYTHASGDLNVDHGIVSRAVLTACRPTPQSTVRQVILFEVPSATGWSSPDAAASFTPNYFVDIGQQLAPKLAALGHYEQEMRAFPHARSLQAVEALARWRGASIGRSAAEAFILARAIT